MLRTIKGTSQQIRCSSTGGQRFKGIVDGKTAWIPREYETDYNANHKRAVYVAAKKLGYIIVDIDLTSESEHVRHWNVTLGAKL